MDVLVPFAASKPKTRLESVLEPDERIDFSRAMLRDICTAVETAGGAPAILSTEPIESA